MRIPYGLSVPSELSVHAQYATDPQELNDMFSKIGEIKSFFDLLNKRGMVFITYVSYLRSYVAHFLSSVQYDVRSASMAKERLQGTPIAGRPVSPSSDFIMFPAHSRRSMYITAYQKKKRHAVDQMRAKIKVLCSLE